MALAGQHLDRGPGDVPGVDEADRGPRRRLRDLPGGRDRGRHLAREVLHIEVRTQKRPAKLRGLERLLEGAVDPGDRRQLIIRPPNRELDDTPDPGPRGGRDRGELLLGLAWP